jgi:hypothetical protein
MKGAFYPVVLVGTLGLAVAIFVRMSAPGTRSDIPAHVRIAEYEWARGRWYTYTLWSPLIGVVSFGRHLMTLRAASVVLLTAAVLAKVELVRRFSVEWGSTREQARVWGAVLVIATPIVALGSGVAAGANYTGAFQGAIYLGRLSGTLWHNSTEIASVPLVLLAAEFARRAYLYPTPTRFWKFGLALAAAGLMKSSYTLVALPVLVPVLFWRSRTAGSRILRRWGVAATAAPAVVVLAVQYRLTRQDSGPDSVPIAFTWEPFRAWLHYAPNPAMALLQSLAFPILATGVVICRRAVGEFWLWISWSVVGVAVLELSLLGERDRRTGNPVFALNWFWGGHLSILILFLASGVAMQRAWRSASSVENSRRTRRLISILGAAAYVALGAHFASGIIYTWRLFSFREGFAT